MFASLKSALGEMQIPSEDIVNAHIHLPEINNAMLEGAKESEGHSMIPREIMEKTIPSIDPRSFYKKNNQFSGSAVILPIESHNIHGKGSILYCSNRRVLTIARRYPTFYIPFMSMDMTSEEAPRQIRAYHTRGMLGLKYHAIEGYSLLDPACVGSLQVLEELGLPVVIHLGDTPFPGVDLAHADPEILIPLANQFPKLRILATHFATPLHHKLFWIASRYENIYLDTAEFPIYWQNIPENPYGGLLSPLNTRRIGIKKFIFGTDFPMPTFKQSLKGSIEVTVHDTAEYLLEFLNLPGSYFTLEEKHQILCENFWTFLGRDKSDVIKSNRQIPKI